MREAALRSALLAWYRPRRRAYAWRRGRRDPYRTLVSEVMLQQTRAARVEPVFEAFVARFPDVRALAEASRADVLRAWSDLGYNRRAVALHEAARAIVARHAGRVPRDLDALRVLPGIGPYTASAVASIGHGLPIAAVDTNVRRVTARVFRGVDPIDAPDAAIEADAERWLDRSAPSEWNQAVMDLGRLVCRPVPRCDACPLAPRCRARRGERSSPDASSRRDRRQPPYEGSARQVRGSVVRVLRSRRSADVAGLATATGHGAGRIEEALQSLVEDGLVERTRAGRFRLPVR